MRSDCRTSAGSVTDSLRTFALMTVGALLVIGDSAALAQFIPVYGGPTYDAGSGTGFPEQWMPSGRFTASADGTAIGNGRKFVNNQNVGHRALRWGAAGTTPVELGHLGTPVTGVFGTGVNALNAAGTAVGFADQYSDTNGYVGTRAVRWNAGKTVATELGHLGTTPRGFAFAYAHAVNTGGTAVGSSSKYAGTYGGTLGVRWDAGGTAATELGHLGLDEDGQAHAYPLAVNDAGTAVGHALKFVAGVGAGFHAVRWDAGTTAATELGHLGTNAAGQATAYAHAVDAAGNAIGSSRKYNAGVYLGDRAVRWEAGATTAAELDNLGTNASGRAFVEASAINAAGTAVGYAEKYVANVNRGERAVRWDAGGTAATELGTLGTLSGVTSAYANAINADGMIVGTVVDYDDNVFRGFRAVLWRADNTAFDLNRLIDPASGWTLNTAESISDTNFVAGLGRFDPDGSGPVRAYERMFVIDASAAIPEPATTGLISIIGSTLLTRRRKLPVPPRREEFCS